MKRRSFFKGLFAGVAVAATPFSGLKLFGSREVELPDGWSYVAIVREEGVFSTYLNGKLVDGIKDPPLTTKYFSDATTEDLTVEYWAKKETKSIDSYRVTLVAREPLKLAEEYNL